MNNTPQKQPQPPQQPDYANMTEQQRMDAAMKQAGMGSIKGMVAKNLAKNMAHSMARNTARGLLSRLFSRFFK